MSDTATSSADAGATSVESIKASLSVPVPATAPPSTTDAQPAPEAAPAPVKAEADKSDEQTKDEQPRAEDGKFKPKTSAEDRKARIQSDIDRLTADKRNAERELLRLREEHARLNKALSETPPPDDPFDPLHATRRAVREDRMEQTADRAREVAQAAIEARTAMFEVKLDAVRERFDDFDDAMKSFRQIPVSNEAADLIVESDKAGDIAYYLAKNPAEALRIARLPAHHQGAEIARIEAKVSQAPQARKTSNAPPPVPIINGTTSPTSKTPAEMSVEELGRLIYARA